MPNISLIKVDQAMKFCQFIEYKKQIFLFKNHAENEPGKLVPDFSLLFKKKLYKLKASGLLINLIIFRQPSTWTYNKRNLAYNKTLDYWSRDMLDFDFLEKDLVIVFLPHFEYDFSRKIFLMLFDIK